MVDSYTYNGFIKNKTPTQAFTLPSEITELRVLFRLFSHTRAGWV